MLSVGWNIICRHIIYNAKSCSSVLAGIVSHSLKYQKYLSDDEPQFSTKLEKELQEHLLTLELLYLVNYKDGHEYIIDVWEEIHIVYITMGGDN